LVERAQKRFVEVHSKYNKKQGQTACDCGGKDGEFWQMLADPKKYLLCAKEACPGLELRPGDDAPQFHLEACSDGTCGVCGWDEEKATPKSNRQTPSRTFTISATYLTTYQHYFFLSFFTTFLGRVSVTGVQKHYQKVFVKVYVK
jgi:hypothetical protein